MSWENLWSNEGNSLYSPMWCSHTTVQVQTTICNQVSSPGPDYITNLPRSVVRSKLNQIRPSTSTTDLSSSSWSMKWSEHCQLAFYSIWFYIHKQFISIWIVICEHKKEFLIPYQLLINPILSYNWYLVLLNSWEEQHLSRTVDPVYFSLNSNLWT